MANIAALLKNEISWLSRREIRKEVQPLRKMAAAPRREIAAMKRPHIARAKDEGVGPLHADAKTG